MSGTAGTVFDLVPQGFSLEIAYVSRLQLVWQLLMSMATPFILKDLEGKRLHTIQQSLEGVDYFIIDEMSMVGRKMFGQVDRRLRQVFPHN